MSPPTTTPNRSGSSTPGASPASAIARSAAANPNWISRLITLRLFRGLTHSFGSKSATSPPNGTLRLLASNCSIGRIPDRPASREAQKASPPIPIGLTTPNPVKTTSRRLLMIET